MLGADVARILDASFNRAGEGLRVVEDFVRFVLDDPFLTHEIKTLRHDLADAATRIPAAERHAARDTCGDVGTEVSTEAETVRADSWAVCAASLKRSEQSLRSLEEYGKLVDGEFATRCESLRYRLYILEKAIDVGRTSRERLNGVRLCVLVDGQNSAAEFDALIAELIHAGVGMIQLREKHLDDRDLLQRARALVSLTRRQSPALPGVSADNGYRHREPPAEPGADAPTYAHTLAFINDRADIAAASDADGVHLGQEDLSVKDARAILGPQPLIGVSTHNIDQARAAVLDGANYLGAGPTFPSETKSFDAFAGLDYLREVASEIHLPTFAIGGIDTDNLSDVLATGISRIAVGSAITAAGNAALAASNLSAMLNQTAAPAAISLTSDP